MNEKYLMANGLRLAYDEFGDPSKPTIVLVMGLGTQMIAWPEPFCQALADQGHRVIRFDNRDVGLSEKIIPKKKINIMKLMLRKKLGLSVKPPYTLRDMAADTIGLLDFLEIDAAHWVGASMGGMIAQILAADYPQRSLSLTSIMSSSGNPDLPQASLKVVKKMVGRRPDQSNEKAYLKHMHELWAVIGSPAYPPNKDDLSARILASAKRSYSPTGYNHHLAAILESGDRRGLLRKIDMPCLVIHGKDDVLIPYQNGVDTADHLKGAKLELIDGMGHDLPRELFTKFVSLICAQTKSN